MFRFIGALIETDLIFRIWQVQIPRDVYQSVKVETLLARGRSSMISKAADERNVSRIFAGEPNIT